MGVNLSIGWVTSVSFCSSGDLWMTKPNSSVYWEDGVNRGFVQGHVERKHSSVLELSSSQTHSLHLPPPPFQALSRRAVIMERVGFPEDLGVLSSVLPFSQSTPLHSMAIVVTLYP